MRYVGEFKDGEIHGQGTMMFNSTGSKYEGEFKDGEVDGQGTFTSPDGTKHEGEFDEDLNSIGISELTFTNGDKYIGDRNDNGDFWNGKLYTNGKLQYEFVNGKKKVVSVFRRLMM